MAHWTENQFQQDIFSYPGLRYLNNFALVNGHLSSTYVHLQWVNHALSFQIGNDKIQNASVLVQAFCKSNTG